ncbi:hypothetical protein ACFO5R_05110 [Halosolutus amylolyticus]|uniref:DUF8027 domain-containing protein n=1 Tax=Halosolutus amylolyticus TaxID=2932267 RepID=A0ABD5PLF9_9EURY|nr:hypothetical protein [Halosolutus amylolyticus]
MPIPGYDPDDLDDALEAAVDDEDLEDALTDEQWEAYRRDDAALVDVLDEAEIERLLDRRSDSTD